MLPLDKSAAQRRTMVHFRFTTTLAPGVFCVTDQFAESHEDAMVGHIDRFVQFHPDLEGAYGTTFVVIDDPGAIGGRPA